ncbi:hypothetical protein CJ026_026090 [Ralstonia pickettii]|uniref:type VII secretion protein EccB n=1 Tax=Ralstonia pickettii TaxID=329 RepID=UPI000CD58208|nr:hypothetical protein CJ026_026090 [Ralstonia pickettii]
MATKSDLIEAQNFSRRRLLTAFTSGAPEGKELEPAAPLRAVIAAIALTAAVVLAGVFYGLIQPGLPSGWQNGKLIIAKDTGARYVTVDGVLHPVLNTASARLLMPAGQFDVINTSQSNLADIPLGSTVGIVGAPDQVPAASALIDTGWTACLVDAGGIAVQLGEAPAATATDRAIVVDAVPASHDLPSVLPTDVADLPLRRRSRRSVAPGDGTTTAAWWIVTADGERGGERHRPPAHARRSGRPSPRACHRPRRR